MSCCSQAPQEYRWVTRPQILMFFFQSDRPSVIHIANNKDVYQLGKHSPLLLYSV